MVADLESRGTRVMFKSCDVTDEVHYEALAAATVAEFGRIINIASQATKSDGAAGAGER